MKEHSNKYLLAAVFVGLLYHFGALFFTLENGKYIADGDGSESTTEMLMDNEHLINGNYGSVTIKDKVKYCPNCGKSSSCGECD